MVKSIVENTRQFVRWMDGTCIETPPQTVSEDEDAVVFSYYSDVVANGDVLRLMATLTHKIQQVFGRINKYLDAFRRYDTLWKKDKKTTLEKFAQRGPSCVKYDKELVLKRKVVAELSAVPAEKDLDFVRVTVGQLIREVVEHAQSWIVEIARHLNVSVRQNLLNLSELVSEYSANMEQAPETLEELKFVLNVISEVRTKSMDMELEYSDIEERYRTLRMYAHAVTAEEAEMVDRVLQELAERGPATSPCSSSSDRAPSCNYFAWRQSR
jgi:dynein heavy chain